MCKLHIGFDSSGRCLMIRFSVTTAPDNPGLGLSENNAASKFGKKPFNGFESHPFDQV